MMANFSIRPLAISLAVSAALVSAPAMADAHSENVDAAATGAAVQFIVGDDVLTAQMPCDEPADGPPGSDGLQTTICIMGARMFIFAASQSVPPSSGPMGSDFDAAYEEVATSADTDFVEEVEVDGRRVMRATRASASGYGAMQAVQFAPDGLAYVIAMSRPNAEPALTEMERQEMRDFVASLGVNQ